MPSVTTQNLFAPSFSCPCSSGVCCDKIFLVATNNCFSDSSHLLSCLSRHRIICCDTIALAILVLLQLLSRPTFLCLDKILSFHRFYFHDIKLLCRDTGFFPSTLNYVALRISLSPFFLCYSSASFCDKEFTSFKFCLSRHKFHHELA